MRRLLLGLCCLLGLVCFADALTKEEVLDLIDYIGKKFRQQCMTQIKTVVKKTLDEVSLPEEGACVSGYLHKTYKDLNSHLVLQTLGMRMDYESRNPLALIPLTRDYLSNTILSNLEFAVKWLPDRLKQISNCTQI